IEFNADDISSISAHRGEAMEIAVQRQGAEVDFDTVKPATGILEVIAELAAAEAIGRVEPFATDKDGRIRPLRRHKGERSRATLDLREGDSQVAANIEARE